ncbi:MAG: D-aminopeptidase [Chloroflexota bacterium]|nr:D-aminopeptidase [Chloroflexota bacterium]
MRARDLGIAIGQGQPGPNNAITDVPGVRVGHCTLIQGDGPLRVGSGPVRTGVTVVLPHEGSVWDEPVFAGLHSLNGNGEVTGSHWIRESGLLTSPIGLTNTHSVGVVRDTLVSLEGRQRSNQDLFWGLPVVGETWDGYLNDIRGEHIRPEHVETALKSATSGPVGEGNVGGGTGMVCHGFKGGIGTASRVLTKEQGGYIVGVLVQANYGRRHRLTVNGVNVGATIPSTEIPIPFDQLPGAAGGGSIIGIVGTNAPLLPIQCRRVAQRLGLGLARTGGVGENTSGDIFIGFATGNRGLASGLGLPTMTGPLTHQVTMLDNSYMTAIFDAAIEAMEEAILNALLAAKTMVGRDGITAYGLDGQRLLRALRS